MNKLQHRCLTVLTIGGAFTGVVITLAGLIATTDRRPVGYLLYLTFVGLYGYGIWAGIRFSENAADLKSLRRYYWMQLPWVSSPLLAYRFSSGFHLTLGVMGTNIQYFMRVGSEWSLNILQQQPWGVGLNFFALIVLIVLKQRNRPNQSLEPTATASTPPADAGAAPASAVAHH